MGTVHEFRRRGERPPTERAFSRASFPAASIVEAFEREFAAVGDVVVVLDAGVRRVGILVSVEVDQTVIVDVA